MNHDHEGTFNHTRTIERPQLCVAMCRAHTYDISTPVRAGARLRAGPGACAKHTSARAVVSHMSAHVTTDRRDERPQAHRTRPQPHRHWLIAMIPSPLIPSRAATHTPAPRSRPTGEDTTPAHARAVRARRGGHRGRALSARLQRGAVASPYRVRGRVWPEVELWECAAVGGDHLGVHARRRVGVMACDGGPV